MLRLADRACRVRPAHLIDQRLESVEHGGDTVRGAAGVMPRAQVLPDKVNLQ